MTRGLNFCCKKLGFFDVSPIFGIQGLGFFSKPKPQHKSSIYLVLHMWFYWIFSVIPLSLKLKCDILLFVV